MIVIYICIGVIATFVLPIVVSSWKLRPLAKATMKLMKDDPIGWNVDDEDFGVHKEMDIEVSYRPSMNPDGFGSIYINKEKLDILEGFRIKLALRKMHGDKILNKFEEYQKLKKEQIERKKIEETNAIVDEILRD